MQADWGNESDDDDDNSIIEKQNKRLSTVEREQIEKEDIESKGIWIMHVADNGRPYYYNSITLQSVWEIPKATNITSATTLITADTATAATTNTITKVAPIPYATNIAATTAAPITTTTTTHTIIATAAVANNNSTIESTARIPDVPSYDEVATNSQFNNKKSSDTDKNQMSNRHSAKDQIRIKTEMQKAEPRPINTNKARIESASNTYKTNNIASNMQSNRRNSNSRPTSRDKGSRLSSSQCTSRSKYTRRSRSPLPPPPRDHYYDDYRYYHRSPSPPPHLYQRRYPSYDRYDSYHPYNYRSRHSPPLPDIRYRYYDPSLPPPSSSLPYYRPRERSWNRYEAHRSRFY
ncbi:hypothetical protein INT46_002593 [Mucor plumbeus]|uniref:WW domain-containing protein n=1 Tax=Mucor plumbeus TaxID=97098 RepID=A0A8H7QCC7_9FUNG|nr:hypothetical protein INT46_002593 [Mucor plumbeus]